jgi:hypothetical protein
MCCFLIDRWPITPCCGETKTWVIVAAKNRACRSGLRISNSVMKVLCPRDLPIEIRLEKSSLVLSSPSAIFDCLHLMTGRRCHNSRAIQFSGSSDVSIG